MDYYDTLDDCLNYNGGVNINHESSDTVIIDPTVPAAAIIPGEFKFK